MSKRGTGQLDIWDGLGKIWDLQPEELNPVVEGFVWIVARGLLIYQFNDTDTDSAIVSHVSSITITCRIDSP